MNVPDDPLIPYVTQLRDARERASTTYCKAVMTLSGGALALSLAFIRDVTGDDGYVIGGDLLVWSWISFAGSIAAILMAMLMSQASLRGMIKQVYANKPPALEGRWYTIVTTCLNVLAAAGFVVGVVLLALVASQNFGEEATGDEYTKMVYARPVEGNHAYTPPLLPPPSEGSER